MDNIKSKVVSGIVWKGFERVGLQVVQLIISIALARVLAPDAYGIIGIITVFISVSNSLIQSSFNTALIQKRDLTMVDISSTFYFMLGISSVLYLGLFFTAPIIAVFYKQELIVPTLRVLGVVIIIGSIQSIQQAIIIRNMLFKKSVIANMCGIVLQGICGVSLAYMGYGVWSLVFSQLLYQVVVCILQYILVRWKPILTFSLNSIKSIWGYGSKLFLSEFITIGYANLTPLIVGKVYTSADLGTYQKGYNFPNMITMGIVNAISPVSLSAMASKQSDLIKVKQIISKIMNITTFILFPIVFGLCAISKDFVLVVLTAQWERSIIYLQLACVLFSLYPIHLSVQALKAIGKSKETLRINLITKIVCIVFLFFTVNISIVAILLGNIVAELISLFITAVALKRNIGYNYFEQIKDVIINLLVSLIMLVIVFASDSLFDRVSIGSLVIKIIIGASVYLILSLILNLKLIKDILSIAKDMNRK